MSVLGEAGSEVFVLREILLVMSTSCVSVHFFLCVNPFGMQKY